MTNRSQCSLLRCICRRLPSGLIAAVAFSTFAAAEPVRMTLLSPEQPDSPFWSEAIRFMNAVADDLGVELDVVISQGTSTYAIRKDGLSIINRQTPPDYILTGYWNESVEHLFEASQDSGTKFFLFNAPVGKADRERVGSPRGRFEHWIGQLLPDEGTAGYQLADILLKHAQALKVNTDRDTVQIAGLTGDPLSTVSETREAGLRKAIGERGAQLNTVISTSWQRNSAAKATTRILKKFPDTTAIWAVADGLALGVIDVLKEHGRQPGVDVVTGGFDWSDAGIEAVRNGEMAATMGGHFADGGWSIILAYDHHHGHDFADAPGTSMTTAMHPITADNVDRYSTLLADSRDWGKVDFKTFSKTHNPEREEYDFSIQNLLTRLEK